MESDIWKLEGKAFLPSPPADESSYEVHCLPPSSFTEKVKSEKLAGCSFCVCDKMCGIIGVAPVYRLTIC